MNKIIKNYTATLDISIEKEINVFAENEKDAEEQINDLMKCRDKLEEFFGVRFKKYNVKELKHNNEE